MNDLLQQRGERHAVLLEEEGSTEQRPDVLLRDRPVHDLRVQHLIGQEAGEACEFGQSLSVCPATY